MKNFVCTEQYIVQNFCPFKSLLRAFLAEPSYYVFFLSYSWWSFCYIVHQSPLNSNRGGRSSLKIVFYRIFGNFWTKMAMCAHAGYGGSKYIFGHNSLNIGQASHIKRLAGLNTDLLILHNMWHSDSLIFFTEILNTY